MEDVYNTFDGYFPGLDVPEPISGEKYHWPLVLNATYSRIMSHFFPTAPAAEQFKIFRLESEFSDRFRQDIANDVFIRSVEFGRKVADAVFRWSATDRLGHEAYLRNNDPGYVPPSGTGRWQPTYPDFSRALLPYWGRVRAFVADATDICPDPLPMSSSPNSVIYHQALEVQRTVNQIKAGRLKEEHWIADFWSDDCPILTFTPAGRWIAVANQVIVNNNASLALAVETYARIGMAIGDAGIRAWHEKYRFNVERPVDYIRRVFNDPNWNTVMCPDGSGQFFTPPFPAYPSGHATIAGACVTILKAFFDSNAVISNPVVASRDGTALLPYTGPALTVGGELNKLAANMSMGRNFAGVHWRSDAIEGILLGEKVALEYLRCSDFLWNESFAGSSLVTFGGTQVVV